MRFGHRVGCRSDAPITPRWRARSPRSLVAAALAPIASLAPAVGRRRVRHVRVRDRPPPTIRVFRTATGSVETVDFRTYLKNVLSREWISSWTTESLRSGAMAVKNYAWYQVLHWRGYTNAAGECFDVFDSTRDQHYDPAAPDLPGHGRGRRRDVGHAGAQGRTHLRDLLQRRRGARGLRRERQRLADVPVGHPGLRPRRHERRPDPGDRTTPAWPSVAAPPPVARRPRRRRRPDARADRRPRPTPATAAQARRRRRAPTPRRPRRRRPTPPRRAGPVAMPGGGQVGLVAPPPPPPPNPEPIVVAVADRPTPRDRRGRPPPAPPTAAPPGVDTADLRDHAVVRFERLSTTRRAAPLGVAGSSDPRLASRLLIVRLVADRRRSTLPTRLPRGG